MCVCVRACVRACVYVCVCVCVCKYEEGMFRCGGCVNKVMRVYVHTYVRTSKHVMSVYIHTSMQAIRAVANTITVLYIHDIRSV